MRSCLSVFGGLVLLVIVVVAACGTGVALGSRLGQGALGGGPAVGIVYVEGTIQGGKGPGPLSEAGAYSDEIVRWLQAAEKNDFVKAVVLRVDTPGGGVTASDEVRNQVLKLKQHKPVVVSMGSTAASGGYYISSPANKIFANETTITGSIGVITIVPNLSGLLEKLGVEVYVLKSGEHKDETTGLRALTEQDRAVLQGVVDETYQRFVTVVSQDRGQNEAAVRQLADGRIYTGRQAKALGLVDELGDLPEAIRAAAELGGISGEPRVIRYRAGGLLSSLGGAVLKQFGLVGLAPVLRDGQGTVSVQYLYLSP